MHPVAALGHVDRFGRVVEGPLEGLRRRVRVHLAQNLGGLVPRHAVDFLLVRPADGFVCGGRGREREWFELIIAMTVQENVYLKKDSRNIRNPPEN